MEVKKIERPNQETVLSLSQFTLPQILFKQAKELGTKKIAIREKMYGIWLAYNWKDYFQYTKHVALGFFALGLKRSENIGIITDNHPEWLFSELGAQAIGAITVNLFTSSIAKELTVMLNRIQATYVVAQDQEQVDKLLEMKEQLPHVRKVIYVDPTGMRTYTHHPWLMSFKELLDLGADLDSKQTNLFDIMNGHVKKSPDETILKNFESVTCVSCGWDFRRPTLSGKCPKCSGRLYFSHAGSLGNTVDLTR